MSRHIKHALISRESFNSFFHPYRPTSQVVHTVFIAHFISCPKYTGNISHCTLSKNNHSNKTVIYLPSSTHLTEPTWCINCYYVLAFVIHELFVTER